MKQLVTVYRFRKILKRAARNHEQVQSHKYNIKHMLPPQNTGCYEQNFICGYPTPSHAPCLVWAHSVCLENGKGFATYLNMFEAFYVLPSIRLGPFSNCGQQNMDVHSWSFIHQLVLPAHVSMYGWLKAYFWMFCIEILFYPKLYTFTMRHQSLAKDNLFTFQKCDTMPPQTSATTIKEYTGLVKQEK
jgi:hypothetical protein